VLLRDDRGRVLVERRPDAGLWAGMWQAPTLEDDHRPPGARRLATWLGMGPGAGPGAGRLRLHDRFDVATTHRNVRFSVWTPTGTIAAAAVLTAPGGAGGSGASGGPGGRHWKSPAQLRRLALATPHRRMLLGG